MKIIVIIDVHANLPALNATYLLPEPKAVARYTVMKIKRGAYQIEHRTVEYDDEELWKTFEQRNVPEREFLYQAFFGGRFVSSQK